MECRGKKKPIEFRGVVYDSLSALARAHGVTPSLFISRYKTGSWTLEQALGLEDRKNKAVKAQKVEFEGVTYSSIKEMATALNYPYHKLYTQLKRVNYDGSKVDLTESGIYKYSHAGLEVEGKTYDSFYALASSYGLSTSLVRSRVTVLGWSIEEAVNLVTRGGKNRK